MKSLIEIFIIFSIVLALALTLNARSDDEQLPIESGENAQKGSTSTLPMVEYSQPSSLRRTSRFLPEKKPRDVMTCDKFPRVCRATGSPGSDCCKKKCVNISTDRLNCGMCGKKCKYSEICCKGKCVNPSSDKKNCGKCNNKCKKGSSCVFGMCSYA